MSDENDLHKCADSLVFQAQSAFSGLTTGDQRRQALMDYHIGLVRLIESVGAIALKITGEIDMEVPSETVNILPRKPFALTEAMLEYEEQGPRILLQQSKLPYNGKLQIGSTVRLVRSTGKYTGQLVPVLKIAESCVHGWTVTVHRGERRFTYPFSKTEPLVETYKDHEIVLRQRRHEVFYFVYGPDGYAACPHGGQGRYNSLAEARFEVDRQLERDARHERMRESHANA